MVDADFAVILPRKRRLPTNILPTPKTQCDGLLPNPARDRRQGSGTLKY